MRYIISGPGRVGGHLLEGIIRASGATEVYRTHNPELSIGNDLDTTLIVLDRRNRFAAMMSNAIVRRTGQSTEYPNKIIDPFVLEPGMFRWEYAKYIDYYRAHDLSRPYAAVFKMYFEDFVNDHTSVKRILNLPTVNVEKKSLAWKLLHSAAPYNFTDIITNWPKLILLYDQLQKGNNQ